MATNNDMLSEEYEILYGSEMGTDEWINDDESWLDEYYDNFDTAFTPESTYDYSLIGGESVTGVDNRLDYFFNDIDAQSSSGSDWMDELWGFAKSKEGTGLLGGLLTGGLNAWQAESSRDRAEKMAEAQRQHDKDMAILLASLKKPSGGGGGGGVSASSDVDGKLKGTFTKRT